MKYLDPKFSSRPASKAYRDNYDRVFGRRRTKKPTTYLRRVQSYTFHGIEFPVCEEVADVIEGGVRKGVDYGLPVFVVKPKKPRRRKP